MPESHSDKEAAQRVADGSHRRPPREDDVLVEHVAFRSDGIPLVGDLYLPSDSSTRARPAVVVAGAWGTVKEQMAAGYGRAMAARGFAALAFDFRSWGQSGGQPRSMEDPIAKSADITAATEFLAGHPAVDGNAIAGLGICAGSSYLASAAGAPLLKSLALVAPALPTRSDVLENVGGEEGAAALIAAADDAMREFQSSGRQTLMPAVTSAAGSVLDYYTDPCRGMVPQWDNTFNVASWSSWIAFDVHAVAARLTKELLVVHSDAAVNPDSVRRFVAQVSAPVEQLWLDEVTQFDFYDQPGPMAAACDAVAAHFERTLAIGCSPVA